MNILMKKLTNLILFLFCTTSYAVMEIPADFESTPIPEGYESSDDVAFWLHPTIASKSLIFGVSKNKPKDGGKSGLGIYDLTGKELAFLEHGRLNNVDIKYNYLPGRDIVMASNRDQKALSLLLVGQKGSWSPLEVVALATPKGPLIEEPYGFCASYDRQTRSFYAHFPMKSGKLYTYKVIRYQKKFSAIYVRMTDFRSAVDRSLEKRLTLTTLQDTIYEEPLSPSALLEELDEKLNRKYQLEGCVSDDDTGILYVGMEQLGVWRLDLRNSIEPPKLIIKVESGKFGPKVGEFPDGKARLTSDIEGLALHYGPGGAGALLVSVQGLNEYAFFDRKNYKYLGSFKVSLGKDEVTETDGLDIISASLGEKFPNGLLGLHDHHNLDELGELERGNYKFVSMEKVLKNFPALQFPGFQYNPRKN